MACITKKRGKLVIDFYDQSGRRRLKTLPEGTSKKDARKILRELEEQIERGTYIPKATVQDFAKVAEDWLDYKKPNIRSSTMEEYRIHVRKHLTPFFGCIKINRINFSTVEGYIKDATDKGVTPQTLKKILINLGCIMSYAVRKRLCDSNPVREIDKPKAPSKRKIDVFQPAEIRAMIEHARDQEFKTLFTVAVMSGLRAGELLGLKWTDIDWFNHQVHVRRTFNYGRFFPPKSATSNRAVDLATVAIHELKRWKLACPPTELDLIFPNIFGTPISGKGALKREFKATLRRAGLRDIRFHDLRHTYASLLIDQGEHPKYIQAQMGHASINITLDTYGHLMKTVNRQASSRLEKAVFGDNGDILETSVQNG